MRRFMFALLGVLLLGVGIALGWFAARGSETGLFGPTKLAISYRPESPELLTAPPALDNWHYPGSKTHASSSGGSLTLGEIQFGGVERIALTTQDDFDRVWTFYKEKCKLQDPGSASSNFRFEGGGIGLALSFTIFDDVQGHSCEGPPSDAGRSRGFDVKSLRYTLVGFISRPKDANETTILLTYRPNSEFISLLKEKVEKK